MIVGYLLISEILKLKRKIKVSILELIKWVHNKYLFVGCVKSEEWISGMRQPQIFVFQIVGEGHLSR